MFALGLSPNALSMLARPGAAVPSAAISAVAADGWQAAMVTPADLALAPVLVSRQGFTSAGAATTIAETLLTTKRVRQPYPNQGVLTASAVALSDFVYSTDSIAGVTNSSAVASPKPVAHWVSTARDVVGNSLTPEIVAFHRNGIACVVFRATDGSTTVTATATAPVVSGRSGDRNAVLVWRAALDLSTLSDNADVTVNARVYPRIGAAASVRDSADLSDAYRFSPRVWRRNTSRAANPPIVYVASGGNDSTGYVGTDDTLASASPCLTLTGAINRARTVLGTAAGSLDGLRVRLTAGTWSRSASPTSNTVNAQIVIEPGTGVAKAAAIMEFGAANNTFSATYVKHRGLTLRRTGAFYLHNSATGHCVTEDCDLDLNGNTGALAGSATVFFFNGVSFVGLGAGSGALSAGSPIVGMLRGCAFGSANSTSQIEPNLIVGCDIRGCRTASGARDISGGVIAFNSWMQAGQASGYVASINQTGPIEGYAFVQNVLEFTFGTSANTSLAPSNDGGTSDVTHFVCWHNTIAGFNDYGRSNILYNEHATTPRTHTLGSFVGNIHVQLNTKHDIHCGLAGIANPELRTGGWSYVFGVGCRDEFARYRNADNGSLRFGQDYPGLGAQLGTGNTGAGLDPLFTSPAHTTSGPNAGAGLGVYTLQSGSPADKMVTDSPLPFDLAGNARAGASNAGAYS